MKRDIFFSFLSALLLILSFPNYNLWIFAWFGFVPLFLAIKGKSRIKAFLLSYLTGIIFWSGIIYWLIHVTFVGLVLLVLYLALYFGVFGLLIKIYELRVMSYELLFIPSIWVLLEYLRLHLFTGFGWAFLGYSQYLNLPVIQIADITGVWGPSFLVMMVNVGLYSVIGYRLSVIGAKIRSLLLILLCIFVTLTYGYYKIHRTPNTEHRTPIRISVIQGNIPQHLKWDVKAKDFIIDQYLELTSNVLKDKPDLIIWPEASFPCVLEECPFYFERIHKFVKETKICLLLGAVTKMDNFYYNSALLISKEDENVSLNSRYDKIHLVPFGEYIPLKKIFGFLETMVPIGDFGRGKNYTVFSLPSKFSVLICFEDLFPNLSRKFIKKGANFLVNITNDAWFGKTSAAHQHLLASVFRTIENRVYLVRCANTGVSGFIAPTGKIISLVLDEFGKNIFISGYDTQEIFILKEKNLSFYSRYGDVFIFANLIYTVIFVYFARMKKANKQNNV